MANKIDDTTKLKTEEILKLKTNQDFNKQKPNPIDPNQLKNIDKLENETEIKKRIDSADVVNPNLQIGEDNINKQNKKEFPNRNSPQLIDELKKKVN